MKSKFLESHDKYDGAQLISLNSYLKHGLLGDSIIAWVGACDVTFEHMVDGEDLLAKATIAGESMLHFIIEKFDISLFAAVSLQRLLATIVKDQLQSTATEKALAQSLFREGDDIYSGGRKLSISIATQSPVSSLIHFAVNVNNKGTPVKTLALEDLGVDPKIFAMRVMEVFCKEIEGIQQATQKVRWVK
ncbi:MAG: DUF366 family protein [Bdellovibrionales bacterium]